MCGVFFVDFVKMGTKFGLRDLPTFMYWLETYLLDDLVQKLRMGSMHSAQDCKYKFYSKGHITDFFLKIMIQLSLTSYTILLFLQL